MLQVTNLRGVGPFIPEAAQPELSSADATTMKETMTPPQPSEFAQYRDRRRRQARDRRLLNNLPLAHRLAARHADDARPEDELLGQAMVGLLDAVDSFEDAAAEGRFGAYAEPRIISALTQPRDAQAVAHAQAAVAAAIASQNRVQELASFLDVPVGALVGGLMDASASERELGREPRTLRGVA